MNILFIAHRPPFPPNKGEKIRTFNQIKYLISLGHSIHVCSPITTHDEVQHLRALDEQHCQSVFYDRAAGKIGYLKALLKRQALSVGYFYSHQLQIKIDHHLNTHQVDAIVCSSSSMAEYLFRSKALSQLTLKPRLIMDFMDLDSDKWRQYTAITAFPMDRVYSRERRLMRSYEKRIHEYFDACLFVSEQEADLYKETIGQQEKIHGISNGLDTDFFKPAAFREQLQGPVFLFTGAMDYLPNTDAVSWFVKHCWPAIRQRYTGAQFYIAGMNPTNKIKALGQLPGIKVTGYVEDIRQYYNLADIFVAPMQVARGLQNKILEAFASGVPVVTSPLGAESIRCKPGHELLIADSPADFLAQVENLLQNASLRLALRNNALKLISTHYSWSGCLRGFEPLVLGKPHSAARLSGAIQ